MAGMTMASTTAGTTMAAMATTGHIKHGRGIPKGEGTEMKGSVLNTPFNTVATS
jgi:hypothetical protein